MKYVLEGRSEFDRLERQSASPDYDVRTELAGLDLGQGSRVLDAGCGSGVGARVLSQLEPRASVVGCDLSADRISAAAKTAGAEFPNLRFQVADLTRLEFSEASFDTIICRYVIEHLPGEVGRMALAELFRCLSPQGLLRVIDIDGGFHNIHPRSPALEAGLLELAAAREVDLFIGRKIPSLLIAAGFMRLEVRVDTLVFSGGTPAMAREADLLRQRFEGATAFFESVLGGRVEAAKFYEQYLAALERPETVVFYNKFIVTGRKPGAAAVKIAA